METRATDLPAVERSERMTRGTVIVIDRTTGAFSRLRDDEPVKMRVCRGCGRVHGAPEICAQSA
jgi:hypothetical protein